MAVLLAVVAAAAPETVSAAGPAWREAAAYLPIFTPASQRSSYRAATVSAALDEVLQMLAADESLVRTAGAWEARRQPPLDAFGRSGGYDRWQLARLYGPRQPVVARGARMEGGRVAETWTLISPYPDPQLTRLLPGTLLIRLRLPWLPGV